MREAPAAAIALLLASLCLALPAFAGEPRANAEALSDCCRALGASSCPEEIFAVGSGSERELTWRGAEIEGIWSLQCGGESRLDSARKLVLAEDPPDGALVGTYDPSAVACFERACAMPEGLCLRASAGKILVAGCEDGLPPTEGMWKNPPREPFGVRFAAERLVGVQADLAALLPERTPERTDQGPLTVVVPERPPLPCSPPKRSKDDPQSLTRLAESLVTQGNEALVAGNAGAALERYRAAISIDRCNVSAWASLGDALLQVGHTRKASEALEIATSLGPSHAYAWARLGEARERGGDVTGAALAFRRALEESPGQPRAAAGMARIGQDTAGPAR